MQYVLEGWTYIAPRLGRQSESRYTWLMYKLFYVLELGLSLKQHLSICTSSYMTCIDLRSQP